MHLCSAQKQWHFEKSTPCPQHSLQKEKEKDEVSWDSPFSHSLSSIHLTISGRGKCYMYCETGEFCLKNICKFSTQVSPDISGDSLFPEWLCPTSKAKTRRICCELTTYFFITVCCLLTIIQPIFCGQYLISYPKIIQEYVCINGKI